MAGEGIAKKVKGKWKVFCLPCVEVASEDSPPEANAVHSLLFQKIKDRLEVLMVDPQLQRSTLAKELYNEFFGAVFSEDEIPF